MPSLPTVTGRQAIEAFGRVGFQEVRINGSHHILRREGHPHVLSVPVHGSQSLKRGTLRSLIRTAGLTVDEFNALL